MGFEFFIALRYLHARHRHSFISVISLISIGGVALGVASLIVVMGVMNGFSNDLRDKMLGVNAHVVILSLDGGLKDYEPIMQTVMSVDGVAGVTPFIYSEVMLSNANGGVKGVVLRGIDPDSASNVVSLSRDMKMGSLAGLKRDGQGLPGIIIGNELALRLGLTLGDRVNLLSPSGRRTSAGAAPSVRIFEIVGTFKTGMYEYDSSLAYTTIENAAQLLGFKTIRATGLEVKLNDVYQALEISSDLRQALGFNYTVRNWMEMNQSLFAALKLEKTAMFIILVLIVLVGSFSIITTLVMLVMEKTRDIAILMSMGARKANIKRIFMLQGVIIGFVGTTIGFVLGISASLLLKKYQFIKLPEDVYAMDHLPVRLEWLDLSLIGVAAMLLCFLATVYPARKAASLEPASALRFE